MADFIELSLEECLVDQDVLPKRRLCNSIDVDGCFCFDQESRQTHNLCSEWHCRYHYAGLKHNFRLSFELIKLTCKKLWNVNSTLVFSVMLRLPVPGFFGINITRNLSSKTRNAMSIPNRCSEKGFISATSKWILRIKSCHVVIIISSGFAEVLEKF